MPKISEYMKKSAGNEEQIKIAIILAGDTITAESAVIYRRAIETAAENFSDDIALEYPNLYPEWNNIIGQTVEVGKRVRHDGELYKCIQEHAAQTDWQPDVSPSLWTKVLIPDPDAIPEWEQPDSTNPYMQGDKVTHNGKTWVSLVDNNVWEPGVSGTENLWVEEL